MTLKYDLALKGGEVIDPSQNLRAVRDVAFQGGKVAAIASDVPAEEAREVVDVSGKIVTPGLIDVHGHYYKHYISFGVSADEVCLPNSVTTTVDAGTAGWLHFDGFREFILKKEKTRLMALVNLSALGQMLGAREGGWGITVGISNGPQTLLPTETIGELQDLRFAQVEETVRCIQDNRNVVLGVKIRIDTEISGEANAIPALERARQVADITGTFVMVHVARVPIPLAQVFDYLRPGDIVTHIFHSAENNVMDEKGRVRSEVMEAKSKSIVLDVGAARRNIGINISRSAIEQGLPPSTISSDITRRRPDRPAPPYTLPEVMSLYMGLGMPLEEVIAATTQTPAKAIGQEGELGTLRVGGAGDAAVLDMEKGDFAYDDGDGVAVRPGQRIAPVMTIKDGKLWRPPS